MATASHPANCTQAPYGQDCCCCKRCSVGGCDLKVIPCGCCLHARCCPVSETQLLDICPICDCESTGLHLIPIAFDEIDQATEEAAKTSLTNKRGKKRQNATVARLNPALQTAAAASGANSDEGGIPPSATESNELRTGRWTTEETNYCDKLIHYFEKGALPIPEKMKLNDFLSNMLKSKQSRLTKKMKNAKLSAKQYKRTNGYILGEEEAREFSLLETDLFTSIKCRMERSELKFHMQKVWRELFSHFCAIIGQKLELDAWLRSVEEMERRASQAMDEYRKARRKTMIGSALTEDTKNKQSGVLIDPYVVVDRTSQVVIDQNGDYSENWSESESLASTKRQRTGVIPRTKSKAKSFVARVMHYVQTRQLPFEHVDVWVPSTGNNSSDAANADQELATSCLSFGGCATADSQTLPGEAKATPLTGKEQNNLSCFGEYSQRFSFKVGSGLPGRVFSSGIPSWEQGIKSAPQSLFERGGGARQWGIETALGMPVKSPNVGRVVVVLYSIHDRVKDQDMVARMMEELGRLMPVPRWKLVVDVGSESTFDIPSQPSSETDLNHLLQSLLTGNQGSRIAQEMEGIVPLTQLLVKVSRSPIEVELMKDTMENFESHMKQGHSETEIAWLTCRDFMLKKASLEQKSNASACATTTANILSGHPGCPPSAASGCCPPSAASGCCPPSAASSCCPPSSNQNGSQNCKPQPQKIEAVKCCPPYGDAARCFPPPVPVVGSQDQTTTAFGGRGAVGIGSNVAATAATGGFSAAGVATGFNVVLHSSFENIREQEDVSDNDSVNMADNDLGVSATQLAQLLQSESAGFSF